MKSLIILAELWYISIATKYTKTAVMLAYDDRKTYHLWGINISATKALAMRVWR